MTMPYGQNYDADGDPVPGLLDGLRNGTWLDEQKFPPLSYAVPGLIPEGFTLTVGPPKAGKSWAALDIGLAKAAGGHALGRIHVGAACPVLYLALEDGHRRLQDRCRSLLGPGTSIPAAFEYLTQVLPHEIMATISEWLNARPAEQHLVMLDTLGKIMPPALAGESAYQRDYRIGSNLKRVADTTPGTALVVLHHDRKAGSEDFVDSVSGTHGLAGAADTIIVLSRGRGESSGLFKVTGRDVAEAEYAIELGASGSWRISGNDLDESVRTATARRATSKLSDRTVDVFALVLKHPQGISPAEVARAVGLDGKAAQTYLARLVEAGRIRKASRGKYAPLSSGVGSVGSVGSVRGAPTSGTNTTHGTNTTSLRLLTESEDPEGDAAALLQDELGATPFEDAP